MSETPKEMILDEPKERRDAAEHRHRILVAARALFAAQGVDATSMTEIARAANIGQGTLYRRFAHKGELCEALLKENIVSFREEIEARFATHQESSALEHLESLIHAMIDFNEQNFPLLSAMMDSANGPRRRDQFQSPFYIWTHGTIVRLLQLGIDDGEIRAVDADLTAHLIIATLKGTFVYYCQHDQGYPSEQIKKSVHALLIDGLRARS